MRVIVVFLLITLLLAVGYNREQKEVPPDERTVAEEELNRLLDERSKNIEECFETQSESICLKVPGMMPFGQPDGTIEWKLTK